MAKAARQGRNGIERDGEKEKKMGKKERKRIRSDLWREKKKKEKDKEIKKIFIYFVFLLFKKLINNLMIRTKSKNQN